MDGINPAYARFCKTVLWLLLFAGLSLMVPALALAFR